jgi:PhoH-like ATPase
MRKNFVLDTNVVLHDARAMYGFADNVVNIPIFVIEELDQFKKNVSELGRNAREVSRDLDRFRQQGRLTEGVPLPGGGVLRVVMGRKELPNGGPSSATIDSAIMGTALLLKAEEPNVPTILVTKDTNLRLRADAVGLDVEDYDKGEFAIDELYPGSCEVVAPSGMLDQINAGGTVPLAELAAAATELPELLPNEYIMLRDASRSSRTVLGRVCRDKTSVEPVMRLRDPVWGISPRNKEQYYALDALLRDDIKLVTLVGKAGTGKTMLAMAAGLLKTVEERRYRRLLVSRPVLPLGRDIGYLPGNVDEKLRPWMQPIHDNVEFLTSLPRAGKRPASYQQLMDEKILEIEPLTYIRGRSIPQQYMVVDEAQNLTPHEVKTVLTRVGEDTKIVLTGDPYQIDHPYVDSVNNGLTYAAQAFRKEGIAAHVTMRKGERSQLAELASNLL